jgi:hypothetical protein
MPSCLAYLAEQLAAVNAESLLEGRATSSSVTGSFCMREVEVIDPNKT